METIGLDVFEKLGKFAPDPTKVKEFAEELKKSGAATIDLAKAQELLGQTVEAAKAKMAGLVEWTSQIKGISDGAFDGIIKGVEEYAESSKAAGESAGVMGVKALMAIDLVTDVIPSSISGMGNLGMEAQKAGVGIKKSFEDLGIKDAKVLKIAEATDRGFALEKQIRAVAMAQGEYSSMIDRGSGGFKNMTEEAENMIAVATSVAQATGQTQAQVMDLAGSVASIPGVLTEAFDTGKEKISQLTAISRVSTAYGIEQAESAKLLSEMYTNVGLKGAGAFEAMSNIYEQAGNSKLRFESFSKSVANISSSFKMLGENTEATTNVVKAFDNVFKDSDISPAAMQEVITQAAAGISKLDAGKAAFISAQTGGPGGLAGNFELKLAQREGRMDEVMQRTMEAMQNQFGGDIVSLEDAAGNQSLAGELQKQMEFIKMSGLASDDNSAIRVLEAMKSGVMDQIELGTGRASDESMKNALKRGEEEQARTAPPIIEYNQKIEQMRLIQSNILTQGAEGLNIAKDTLSTLKDGAEKSGTTGIINASRESSHRHLDKNEQISDQLNGTMQAISDMAISIKEKFAPKTEFVQGHSPQVPSLDPSLLSPVGEEYQAQQSSIHLTSDPVTVKVGFDKDAEATVRAWARDESGKDERGRVSPMPTP